MSFRLMRPARASVRTRPSQSTGSHDQRDQSIHNCPPGAPGLVMACGSSRIRGTRARALAEVQRWLAARPLLERSSFLCSLFSRACARLVNGHPWSNSALRERRAAPPPPCDAPSNAHVQEPGSMPLTALRFQQKRALQHSAL